MSEYNYEISFRNLIEEAFGEFACSDSNPCGGTGYYDEGDDKPFRVLFSDGCECESFATKEEAIEAAEGYLAEFSE